MHGKYLLIAQICMMLSIIVSKIDFASASAKKILHATKNNIIHTIFRGGSTRTAEGDERSHGREESIEIVGSNNELINGLYLKTDFDINGMPHFEKQDTLISADNRPNTSSSITLTSSHNRISYDKIHLYWSGNQWIIHYDMDPTESFDNLLAYSKVKSRDPRATSNAWYLKTGKSFEIAPDIELLSPGETLSIGESVKDKPLLTNSDDILGIPRRLVPLFISFVLDSIATGLAMPLLPFYIMGLGANALQLSLVVSSNYIVQMIGVLVMGYISDRCGRRRVLLACLLASSASYFAVSQSHSLIQVALARIIVGSFGGLIPVMQSCVADVADSKDRPQYIGRVTATFGLGFVIGPIISSLLPSFSTRTKIRLASMLPLCGFLISLFFFKETKSFGSSTTINSVSSSSSSSNSSAVSSSAGSSISSSGTSTVTHKSKSTLISSENMSPAASGSTAVTASSSASASTLGSGLGLGLASALSSTAPAASATSLIFGYSASIVLLALNGFLIMYSFATETVYAMFLKDSFGYGEHILSMLFAMNGLLIGIFQVFFIKPMVNIVGPHVTLAIGNAILAIGMAGFALVRMELPHFMLFALHIIGYSIADTALVSLITSYSSSTSAGRDLALNQSAQSCARVIGPLLAGMLYEQSKLQAGNLPIGALPFLAGAFCPCLAIAVPLVLVSWSKRDGSNLLSAPAKRAKPLKTTNIF